MLELSDNRIMGFVRDFKVTPRRNTWQILIGCLFILSACSEFQGYVNPNLGPHLYKNVAMIVSKSTNSIESALLEEVTQRVEQRLDNFSYFSEFYSKSQTQSYLQQHLPLQLQMNQFETTFALTGISDKNITSQFGKALHVEQLLMIQVDELPCSECDAGKQLLIKFNLVDVFTGTLLWRGRVLKELVAENRESSVFRTMVMQSVELMLDEFTSSFKASDQSWVTNNFKKMGSLFDIF